MKIKDNSILLISRAENSDTEKGLNSKDDSKAEKSSEEKITTFVCLEDDTEKENIKIINFRLNKTFEDYLKKIQRKFSLSDDIPIRIRK